MSFNRVFSLITSISLITISTVSAFFKPVDNAGLSNNIRDIIVKSMDGKQIKLSDFKGKVLMIVNVASKCGNTPQYAGLEKIYEKYKSKGFEILAFPCNDFGGQEPGTNEEIKEFCSTTYNVSFPLFDKVKVLGKEKVPLYERLTNNSVTSNGEVKWNFEKFLIDRNGNIVARFGNKTKPESEEITQAVEKELSK